MQQKQRKQQILPLLAVAFLCFFGHAWAGPDITGIEWQSSRGFGKAKRLLPFTTILQWKQGPLDKPPGHLRILVTLTNEGAKSVEGSILRCSISMHLVKYKTQEAGEDSQDGVWGVPFWIEERRIPKIKPARSKEVVISHFNLQEYLKRLRGTGFWPDALKVRIMVEPRVGETLKNIPESVIPVVENRP